MRPCIISNPIFMVNNIDIWETNIMAEINHQYSLEDKLEIVRKYFDTEKTAVEFAEEYGISKATLLRWSKTYKEKGVEGLTRKKSKLTDAVSPELTTDDELRKEILKLRIENERLKKNYIVQKNPDGQMEYIRLRAKNTK